MLGMFHLYKVIGKWPILDVYYRLAAEERVRELQSLVEDAFKQFSLDSDSGEELLSEDSLSNETILLPSNSRGSYPFLNLHCNSSVALKSYLSSPTLMESRGGDKFSA